MRSRIAVATIIALTGCTQTDRVVEPSHSSFVLSVEQLARAFALGMAQPEARVAVRDAMRASPYTEHKLSLRGFASSRAGQRLIDAAARASGLPVEDLHSSINALPDLDFYVPIQEQRRNWLGTPDYVVSVNISGAAPTSGFDSRGERIPLDLSRAEPPKLTIVMLQAAEPKSPRIGRQANVPGPRIQDSDDGTLSGSVTFSDRWGKVRTIFLGDMDEGTLADIARQMCLEDCGGGTGGGGGGSPPSPPSTYLERIATQGICDNGFCGEGNEFEFRAMTPGGTTNAIRIEGIQSTEDRYLHMFLIAQLPPMWVGGEGGAIAARETDNFGDDLFFFTDLGYCGAVVLNGNDDKLVNWFLTEGSCDVFAYKGLAVSYTW